MLVWCRAYDCRSVSVGLIFPFSGRLELWCLLSGFDGPIEGLARCALVRFWFGRRQVRACLQSRGVLSSEVGTTLTGDGERSALVGRSCSTTLCLRHWTHGERPFGRSRLYDLPRFVVVAVERRRKSFSGADATLPGIGEWYRRWRGSGHQVGTAGVAVASCFSLSSMWTGYAGRLVRGGSSSHQYQRKFNIPILLIGGHILLQTCWPLFYWPVQLDPRKLGDGLYGAWPVHRGVSTLPAWCRRWSGFRGQSWPLKAVQILKRCGSLTGRLLFLLYHWELGGTLSTSWIRRPRWGSICYLALTVAGVLPSLFGGPTRGKSFLSLQWGSVVWVCRLKLATHQASFHIFRHVLLHARPVCYLLECFIGGLGAVVSCAWCIVGQHHPPLAVRDYELWRS